MEASVALAEAVKLADVDVVAAYPITPQTHIVEHLAELVANGEMDAEFVPVESEHSAMSACLGSSAAGARSFTATAGQGLELMHEVLYVAAGMRLPIVMSVVNRALSAPISIWGDHSDAMSVRDCGWVQMFAENGQEVLDLILCAFRVAEDPTVLLPTMVHLDGFYLSHVVEPIVICDESKVRQFIPPYKYPFPLRPDKPVTMGAVGPPLIYSEAKRAQDVALRGSKSVIMRTWKQFGELFDRQYSPVEEYRTDDAQVLLLTMGSFSETAMTAIDKVREKGEKVGLIRLRLWRPFPFDELRRVAGNAKTLIVLDRCLSFGGPGGPVCSEVKSAFYRCEPRPDVVGFVGGLGGRDISPDGFVQLIHRGMDIARSKDRGEFEMFGVRE